MYIRPLKLLQSCPQLHDTPLILSKVLVGLFCFVPILIPNLVLQLPIPPPPLFSGSTGGISLFRMFNEIREILWGTRKSQGKCKICCIIADEMYSSEFFSLQLFREKIKNTVNSLLTDTSVRRTHP